MITYQYNEYCIYFSISKFHFFDYLQVVGFDKNMMWHTHHVKSIYLVSRYLVYRISYLIFKSNFKKMSVFKCFRVFIWIVTQHTRHSTLKGKIVKTRSRRCFFFKKLPEFDQWFWLNFFLWPRSSFDEFSVPKWPTTLKSRIISGELTPKC